MKTESSWVHAAPLRFYPIDAWESSSNAAEVQQQTKMTLASVTLNSWSSYLSHSQTEQLMKIWHAETRPYTLRHASQKWRSHPQRTAISLHRHCFHTTHSAMLLEHTSLCHKYSIARNKLSATTLPPLLDYYLFNNHICLPIQTTILNYYHII